VIRGFASGILVGGVLSALTLAVVSYVAPSENAAVPAVVPVVPADGGAVVPGAGTPTAPPAAVPKPVPDAPAGAVTPVTPAPANPPADGAPAPKTETAPATTDTGAVTPAAVPTPVPATDSALAEPIVPTPPQVPADTGAADKTAAAVIPPAASVRAPLPQVRTALAPLAPAPSAETIVAPRADDVARAADAPGGLAPIAPEDLPKLPALPSAPPDIDISDTPPPVVPPFVEPKPDLIAQAEPELLLPGAQKTLPQIGDEVAPPAMEAPLPQSKPLPRILTEDEPLDVSKSVTLTPAPRLGGGVAGVVTGRLPRIGQASTSEGAAAEGAADAPLVRYARSFENPDNKPVFSIVLIDTGAPELDRDALAALPFPVSFALDPMDAAAPAHAAIYRAAGQEVLMLATGIPEGATASDLEVSFAALSERLPEAVAVLDQQDPVFQDNRPLATQVVPILAAQGRGLVTWDEGLNAADQVARREGLPSVMAFRDLDSDGENAETVRRYLDRAAFRAAQDGRVVVIGQTRPETVEALIAWGLEGRSASVALAPISAALSVN
jgi:uncharacterized protein